MKERFLEAGRIVNTHGISGEVKIQPWADSPSFLTGFKYFYINGTPVNVLSARVHKDCVLAVLEGVDDISAAIKLKNKTIFIDREDTKLDEGRHFVADLIGLTALDAQTGAELGVISDVLTLPSNDVYVISGEREMLVPAVPEFIVESDLEEGYVRIHVIEGL